ncbi:hypothetical protein [Phycicoccus sonneratiae]|uniref:Uncharacterized protein n=1 Tax=Phycicoccus sonneratiae TaxID=2807628 RepID=A0ABS2CP52_9MICO|nr:hypothetical protein [Phycicoccus sonneraticus]MBM6401667.1 hypothetical protein [Phycicoccus sonneraticus]
MSTISPQDLADMVADSQSADPDAEDATSGERERSTIKFPYSDLKDAVTVVETLKENFSTTCSSDQLAAALAVSPTSSGFRTKVATAAAFGLVNNKRGTITLTDLGHAVADAHTREAAVVEAFLRVELFSALYEKFQGRALPGDAGLEAELLNLGVAQKQVGRARQILQRSAQTAGFFWAGRDRLVKPSTKAGTLSEQENPPKTALDEVRGPRVEEESDTLADDPVLKGLWLKLPKSGSFPKSERDRWLNALKVNLDLVYGPGDEAQGAARQEATCPASQSA